MRRIRCHGVGGSSRADTAGVVALDVVLADRQDRGDDQVPDAGHDQQRDRLEVHRVDELDRVQELGDRDHARQGRGLEHRDGLVAGRRDDHPHRLRQDDPAHRQGPAHAQRLRGLDLAVVDGQDAGPDDLGHVGALVEPEPEDGRSERA